MWTEPAIADLDAIAEYIALDNPIAAGKLVKQVLESVSRLEQFPNSGRRPAELGRTSYREVVTGPCRIFYRVEKGAIFILHVMRAERQLRRFLLAERNRAKE